jgi:hypothetical protein
METTAQRASTLNTIGAIVLALVTWIIVDAIATMILVAFDLLTTVLRPQIIGLINNILGAVFGVFAAGFAVEKWVRRYSGRAVAIAFFVVCALIVLAEWFILQDPAHPFMVTAGGVTTVIVAYQLFWRGEI